MNSVFGCFLVCNLLARAVGMLSEFLFLGALGLVCDSNFAYYAIRAAVMCASYPVICYLFCYRFNSAFAECCRLNVDLSQSITAVSRDYAKRNAKPMIAILAASVFVLTFIPRDWSTASANTANLLSLCNNLADLLLAPASLFVEYLPKFIFRADYMFARLGGASLFCLYVLFSHRIALGLTLGEWKKTGIDMTKHINARQMLRLLGMLFHIALWLYLCAWMILGDATLNQALFCLMIVASMSLVCFFECVWSVYVKRSAFNIIRLCVVLFGSVGYLGFDDIKSGSVLIAGISAVQFVFLLIAFKNDKMLIRSDCMLTKKDIHKFLSSNNIRSTDTVLVHTSFRSLGEVEGGCDGFIDAMCEYLSDGLFLVPSHTWANVTAESPTFDVRSTEPCIGALPRTAAKRSDGVRSLHPTHSLVAFGARAREFVRGEENARTPCPVGGAWARLYDEEAKILLIGVGLNRNTYIHAIDEMIDLPDRLAAPVTLHVIGYDGEEYSFEFQKHGENTGSENFGVFAQALSDAGTLTYTRLGEAWVGIFDAVRGTEVIKKLWANADHDLTRDI